MSCVVAVAASLRKQALASSKPYTSAFISMTRPVHQIVASIKLPSLLIPTLLLLLGHCANVVSQGPSGGVVTPTGWQEWIQESGKNSGGISSFVCPSNQVMIARQHKGDENGNTRYECAIATFDGTSVFPLSSESSWSGWMQESGKNSGGQSEYQCPISWVMLGREHKGDENGDTRYRCAPMQAGSDRIRLYPLAWSGPIQESGKDSGGTSSFVCDTDQVMIARRHAGDENGYTWYRCAGIAWDDTPVLSGVSIQGSWIQESGKKTGGTSSYICPDASLMIARLHEGDENGDTEYWCSSPVLANYTLHQDSWSSWIQESGKNSGGESSFVCPVEEALIGREHQGDENGNTRYRCAWVFVKGELVRFDSQPWSPWMQESGKNSGGRSHFVCPTDSFMVGREHRGDENGDTRYQCGSATLPYQSATLDAVYALARRKVGDPATRNSNDFVTRAQMGLDPAYYLHLDIGGEGFHSVYGVTAGFASAININAQTHDSQPPYNPIPLLIHVDAWNSKPPYPFADGSINYLTIQSAPLTSQGVNEFTRVIASKGTVGLWVDMDDGTTRQNVEQLARNLQSHWYYSCSTGLEPCSSSCTDEFFSQAGFNKVCIVDNRPLSRKNSLEHAATSKTGEAPTR